MEVLASLLEKRDEILAIAGRHGATNIRIFGSVARKEARPDSDIDFLVDVGAVHSPWFPVRLIRELKAALNKEVDIVTERGLNPRLREQVLREAVRL